LDKNRKTKKFWNRYAKLYDFEILRFNRDAYEKIYSAISNTLDKSMDVLEIATGTGLIALHIADSVHSVQAIDFSPKMIDTAKKKVVPKNVSFSVEDATKLSFSENTFDAVIISNALHIMPEPRLVLSNIRKVLKPGGLLIAPTYSQGHLAKSSWNFSAFILKLAGFQTYAKWFPEEYVFFIEDNGFSVEYWTVLRAAFPLVYLEARSKKARSSV